MSDDQEFLTSTEAAEILKVAPITLSSWRRNGAGPPWSRIGPRTIRYSRSALAAYLEATKEQKPAPRKRSRSNNGLDLPKRKPGRPTFRDTKIRAAVLSLDPANDEHWISGGRRMGQAKLTAVSEAAGVPIYHYRDIDKAAPGLTRDVVRTLKADTPKN